MAEFMVPILVYDETMNSIRLEKHFQIFLDPANRWGSPRRPGGRRRATHVFIVSIFKVFFFIFLLGFFAGIILIRLRFRLRPRLGCSWAPLGAPLAPFLGSKMGPDRRRRRPRSVSKMGPIINQKTSQNT